PHLRDLHSFPTRRSSDLVRKRFAEISHERLDIRMPITRRMQRVLQEHVGSGELVNDAEIAGFTPEIREPAAYRGLVVFFFGHDGDRKSTRLNSSHDQISY